MCEAAVPPSVNDYPAGTPFQSLTLRSDGYHISGNGITLLTSFLADTSMVVGLPSEVSLAIGGTAGLTKTGVSGLSLSGANTYTGLTAVNAGEVLFQVSDTDASGKRDLTGVGLQPPL